MNNIEFDSKKPKQEIIRDDTHNIAEESVARDPDRAGGSESVSPALEKLEKKGFFEKIFGRKEKGAPMDYMSIGMSVIQNHPSKELMYDKYLAEDAETGGNKAEKYIKAVGQEPDVKYWGWEKGNFVDKTKYSGSATDLTGGKN